MPTPPYLPAVKRLLLVLISSCFTNLLLGQINQYFENNPIWTLNAVCYWGGSNCGTSTNYNYLIGSDTIIDDKVYKKLHYQYVSSAVSNGPGSCPDGSSGFSLQGLIRSEGKKVYYKYGGDEDEQLLYDFDLAVGDTLPLTEINVETLIVSSIDSVETAVGFRKRFHLENPVYIDYLIEGFGHNRGLLEHMYIPFDCGINLTCLSINDSAFFPEAGPSCGSVLSTQEGRLDMSFSLFPNPLTDYVQIISDYDFRSANLQILDINGKLIYSENDLFGSELRLDLRELSQGLHLLRILENGEILIQDKIVLR